MFKDYGFKFEDIGDDFLAGTIVGTMFGAIGGVLSTAAYLLRKNLLNEPALKTERVAFDTDIFMQEMRSDLNDQKSATSDQEIELGEQEFEQEIEAEEKIELAESDQEIELGEQGFDQEQESEESSQEEDRDQESELEDTQTRPAQVPYFDTFQSDSEVSMTPEIKQGSQSKQLSSSSDEEDSDLDPGFGPRKRSAKPPKSGEHREKRAKIGSHRY